MIKLKSTKKNLLKRPFVPWFIIENEGEANVVDLDGSDMFSQLFEVSRASDAIIERQVEKT